MPKQIITKYILFIFGLLLNNYASGQSKAVVNAINNSTLELSKKQEELIFEKSKSYPNNTQLSIAIIQDGVPQFIGIEKKNDSLKTCLNNQSVFEVGSITKVFTATLLSEFVSKNKINLDDSLQDHLDFKLKFNDTITLKELANHTSGLPKIPSNLSASIIDSNNPYKDYNNDQLIAYLKNEVTLNHTPGKKHESSNLGAGILGFVLSKMDSTSYETLLQENIFKKYGMLNSTSQLKNATNYLVNALNPKGKKTSNWDFDALAGAGGILSNVTDLSKFALAQFDNSNKTLKLTQQPTFKISHKMSKGLGWTILRANNNQVIWHHGRTGGYTSSIALDVQHKNGIIILSNLSGFYEDPKSIDHLCFGLIQTL